MDAKWNVLFRHEDKKILKNTWKEAGHYQQRKNWVDKRQPKIKQQNREPTPELTVPLSKLLHNALESQFDGFGYDCRVTKPKKSVSEFVVEKPTVETNEPKTARKENEALIIEEWVSDSDEENVPKGNPQQDLKDKGGNTSQSLLVRPKQSVQSANHYKCAHGFVRTTFVKSLMKKMYCPSIDTDEFNRKPALMLHNTIWYLVTILKNIDHLGALTNSMNYKPVVTGNQSNGNAVQSIFKDVYPLLDSNHQGRKEKNDAEDPGNKDSEVLSTKEPRVNQEKDDNVSNTNNVNTARVNSTNTINTVSPTVNAAGIEIEKEVYVCSTTRILKIQNFSRHSDISALMDCNQAPRAWSKLDRRATIGAEYIAASNCCGQLMLLGHTLTIAGEGYAARHKPTTCCLKDNAVSNKHTTVGERYCVEKDIDLEKAKNSSKYSEIASLKQEGQEAREGRISQRTCRAHKLRNVVSARRGMIVGIKSFIRLFGIIAALIKVSAAREESTARVKLMLLVYKLLLLVFRVNAAGTKLQLLTELQLLMDKD
ncbi:hypothetical protein Tco_0680173 [Tanacetum coccineum]|uniref:Uncharacterized protein n=1 Tax=Tanacetum coccineum TaxID=301880 RepID=A0ABQ4XK32_9ASTR